MTASRYILLVLACLGRGGVLLDLFFVFEGLQERPLSGSPNEAWLSGYISKAPEFNKTMFPGSGFLFIAV